MGAKTPPKRTSKELHNALTHVAYEAEALARAAEQFRAKRNRLVLEAGLLHVRNLTEFFWAPGGKHRPHRDGVYAVHYLDNAIWKRMRGGLGQSPNQLYGPMCQQLSHISVKRSRHRATVRFDGKLSSLSSDTAIAWCAFQDQLVGSKWERTVKRAVARWRAAK